MDVSECLVNLDPQLLSERPLGRAPPVPFALNLVRFPTTHLKEGRAMKRALVIITLAITMFGIAAIAMGRHHHTQNAYADLRR